MRPKNESLGIFRPHTVPPQTRVRFSTPPWKITEEWNSTEVPETRLQCKNVTVPCTMSNIGWLTTVVSVLATMNTTSNPMSSPNGLSSFPSTATTPFSLDWTEINSSVTDENIDYTMPATTFSLNDTPGYSFTSDHLTTENISYTNHIDQEYDDLNGFLDFQGQSYEDIDSNNAYVYLTTEQANNVKEQTFLEEIIENSTEISNRSTELYQKNNPTDDIINTLLPIDNFEPSTKTDPMPTSTSPFTTTEHVCIQRQCELVPVERFTTSSESISEGPTVTFPMSTRTTQGNKITTFL